MTNTIVTTRTTPFEFLMNYLRMLGGSAGQYGDYSNKGISVSREVVSDDHGVPYAECRCGEEDDLIALKFSKEFDGRLISFVEYTCEKCGERQYGV
jgi:hypothetical protein